MLMEKRKQSHMWNPWHGCHKTSPGCQNCYVYHQDKEFNKDSSIVQKSISNFNMPIRRNRQRQFSIESGNLIHTCFTSDFFLEEADKWRPEAWEIIQKRPDLNFIIPTKRIHRFLECIPPFWGKGLDNVAIAVSCENQIYADKRLPFFLELPIKHKLVFVAPILEEVHLEKYLATGKIEKVAVGGESYDNARPCNFDWVLSLYGQCKKYNTAFEFYQTGSNFVKNGKTFKISHFKEYAQAKKAGLDFEPKQKTN